MAASGSIWSRNVVAGTVTATSITADDLEVDSGTFSIDETNNRVGIGTTEPDGALHVMKASAGSVTASGDGNAFVVEADDVSGVTLLAPNEGVIYFGDVADNDIGRIRYNHATDSMRFWTNNAERVRIESDGKVGIGVSDPDTTLEVLSTATQQKWSYDADSFATLTVDASSHTTIATGETGDLTLDAGDDIILDSHVGKWRMMRNGTLTNMISTLASDGSSMIFDNQISDADYVFKCSDGGVGITALTIDASEAGAATFNSTVTATGFISTGNITVGGTATLGEGKSLSIGTPLLPTTDHTSTGLTAEMLAGGAIAAFQTVCIHTTTGEVVISDADAIGTMPVIGIAPAAISDTATGTILLQGFIRDDTWNWTLGGILYASGTAGAMTQTAPTGSGDFVQAVGIALSADVVYFNPSLTLVEVA